MSESNPVRVYQHISIALLVALGFLIFYIAFNSGGNSVVDFGDDSHQFANNGLCSDTRFRGEGMGNITGNTSRDDATDCSSLFNEGRIFLSSEAAQVQVAAIDFGDDEGDWPLDEECADPRFEGTGLAFSASRDDIRHDATDCRNLLYQGMVHLVGEIENLSQDGIDFGDDLSEWANDGECDDPRFSGSGMASASTFDDSNIAHDASDCLSQYNQGNVVLGGSESVRGIDFGDILANGGEIENGVLEAGDETLGESGEYKDTYLIEGFASQRLILDLRSDEFDTYLIVNAPDGEQVENDDYQGNTNRSYLSVDVPANGTYEVVVTSYSSGESGAYVLGINRIQETE